MSVDKHVFYHQNTILDPRPTYRLHGPLHRHCASPPVRQSTTPSFVRPTDRCRTCVITSLSRGPGHLHAERLSGQLSGRLSEWLSGWLSERFSGRLSERLSERLSGRPRVQWLTCRQRVFADTWGDASRVRQPPVTAAVTARQTPQSHRLMTMRDATASHRVAMTTVALSCLMTATQTGKCALDRVTACLSLKTTVIAALLVQQRSDNSNYTYRTYTDSSQQPSETLRTTYKTGVEICQIFCLIYSLIPVSVVIWYKVVILVNNKTESKSDLTTWNPLQADQLRIRHNFVMMSLIQ